jgi:hypothetical protein
VPNAFRLKENVTPTIDHLSKRQLNTLIATAKTPAEHQRIAEFYLSQAQDYVAQSKEHAQDPYESHGIPFV